MALSDLGALQSYPNRNPSRPAHIGTQAHPPHPPPESHRRHGCTIGANMCYRGATGATNVTGATGATDFLPTVPQLSLSLSSFALPYPTAYQLLAAPNHHNIDLHNIHSTQYFLDLAKSLVTMSSFFLKALTFQNCSRTVTPKASQSFH
jgi:hypothetical protein